MEDATMINLWKSYDKKLEAALVFNRQHTIAITQLKVQSFLASMKPLKMFTIVVGIIWVAFVDVLIINLFHIASPFFLVSAIVQVFLTKLAIVIYLYQLILIHQADISEPVLATQDKLARLKSSTLWVTRLLFLQLPVWTTFYINKSMFDNGTPSLWSIQILVTLSFTAAAVWLFLNINYENRNKKWFRLIFTGKEWTPILQSMELLNQVDAYEKLEETGN